MTKYNHKFNCSETYQRMDSALYNSGHERWHGELLIASSALQPFAIRRVIILSETLARASFDQALAVFVSFQAVILLTGIGALYVSLKC